MNDYPKLKFGNNFNHKRSGFCWQALTLLQQSTTISQPVQFTTHNNFRKSIFCQRFSCKCTGRYGEKCGCIEKACVLSDETKLKEKWFVSPILNIQKASCRVPIENFHNVMQ